MKEPTHPTVTLDHIESCIVAEHYFTAEQGVRQAYKDNNDVYLGSLPNYISASSLPLLTFCILVLKNGFTIVGESACASPDNFDAEKGKLMARNNAVSKIWKLEGYLLKQKLYENSKTI